MEDQIINFINANWQWMLLGFFIAEKLVKMSPSKNDDIMLDVVWGGIKKIVGRK
jgi:hypothetical protein